MNRRNLLKLGGAASMLPFLNTAISNASIVAPATNRLIVDMTGDGRLMSPVEYAELLKKTDQRKSQHGRSIRVGRRGCKTGR